MEKGALLPIRFYPSLEWIDYLKYKNYSGDMAIPTEHHIMTPSFQMVMPDVGRHWGEVDFTAGTMEIVNYVTGVALDLTQYDTVSQWEVLVSAGSFRNLVWNRWPIYNTLGFTPFDEGLYYYHFQDQSGDTDWYSDLFRLCDLDINALTEEFGNDSGLAALTSTYDATEERISLALCKTGAAEGSCYTEVDVILGEELDLFLIGQAYVPACGAADWNDPVYFELRTTDTGIPVSNTVMIDASGGVKGVLTAEVGGTVNLTAYVLAADSTAAQIQVWLQRKYTSGYMQVRWSNEKSFCKMFYENDYENVWFFDCKQVIDQQALEENVVEDDQANKYRIIGTNQKWNSLQISGGEVLLNAMSLLRLHSNIQVIRETGEIMDVKEILLEQSVLDYQASLIKLVYREESCSVENCGFEPCCPAEGSPIMEYVEYGGAGSLPAAGAGNNGWYVMVMTAADQYTVYLSNGAAWAAVGGSPADTCREARYAHDGTSERTRFFWYDTTGVCWREFIDLASTADNADGTGDLNTDTEYADGLTVVGQYQDADGEWHECTDPEDLTAGAGAVQLITLNDLPGVGTWNFRLHIYTDDCDYGYSNILSQAIT